MRSARHLAGLLAVALVALGVWTGSATSACRGPSAAPTLGPTG